MREVKVVTKEELHPVAPTPGIFRAAAFESDDVIFVQSTVNPGAITGWHYHGDRDVYGYMVSGRLHLEYGKGGKSSAAVGPGEFFHVSSGMVHRDINPSQEEGQVVIVAFVGKGPLVVNVSGPET